MCAKVQLNIFRTKVCADNVFPSASIKNKWLLRAMTSLRHNAPSLYAKKSSEKPFNPAPLPLSHYISDR